MKRLALACALVLAACGPGKSTGPIKPDPTAKIDDPTCPVLVAGTSVSVEDTDQGAAFVFVTTGDPAAVRTRAAALAETHNKHHGAMVPAGGGGHGHGEHVQMPPDKPRAQMGTMIGIHSKAEVADVPNGARVTFTVASPPDAAKLQSELRMHAQHLGNGTCEM